MVCHGFHDQKWRYGKEKIREIRPTDVALVIAPGRNGKRAVFPMKWGYSGKTLLINARAETAAEKPTFREDWRRHHRIAILICRICRQILGGH